MPDTSGRPQTHHEAVANILEAAVRLLAGWRQGDQVTVTVRQQTPEQALAELLGDAAPAVGAVRGTVELTDTLVVKLVKSRSLGAAELHHAKEKQCPT